MAVVTITGASSGLGEHLALELARRGHAVGLVARRVEKLEAVRARIVAAGGTCAVAGADVTDPVSLGHAFASLEQALGPVEICVANAGVEGKFDVDDVRLDDVRHTFEVNVFGAIHTVAAVLPGMKARNRGQLVVVSSVAGNRGLPKSAPYSASKAAISVFWEGLRVDLASTGITCTTIHPGFVRTEMTATNDFPMPFLLEPEDAARRMANAIEGQRRTLTYPLPMWALERVMRVAPPWLFDAIIRRLDVRT